MENKINLDARLAAAAKSKMATQIAFHILDRPLCDKNVGVSECSELLGEQIKGTRSFPRSFQELEAPCVSPCSCTTTFVYVCVYPLGNWLSAIHTKRLLFVSFKARQGV